MFTENLVSLLFISETKYKNNAQILKPKIPNPLLCLQVSYQNESNTAECFATDRLLPYLVIFLGK